MTTRLRCAGPSVWHCVTAWLLLVGVAGCSEAPPPARFEVVEASIAELGVAMDEGPVTSEQLVEQYLDRIEAYDEQGPALNAIIVLNPSARLNVSSARGSQSADASRSLAPRQPAETRGQSH